MKAVIIGDERIDEWDRFADTHPYSIAWHRYGWNEMVRRHYPVKFYPIAACDASEIRGILPLYHVSTLRSPLSNVGRMPILVTDW